MMYHTDNHGWLRCFICLIFYSLTFCIIYSHHCTSTAIQLRRLYLYCITLCSVHSRYLQPVNFIGGSWFFGCTKADNSVNAKMYVVHKIAGKQVGVEVEPISGNGPSLLGHPVFPFACEALLLFPPFQRSVKCAYPQATQYISIRNGSVKIDETYIVQYVCRFC